MGRRAQRKRSKQVADELVRQVFEKQVEPQLAAERARALGMQVDIGMVRTSSTATGWTVTCAGCGRTAKLPYDPGERVGLCPQCIRDSGV